MTTTLPSATAVAGARRAPGPSREDFFMGSLSSMRRDPLELLLRLHREYGDVVRFRLGPYTIHLVADPELIGHVLLNNNGNYVRGKMYHQFKCFMGNGLLTNDGSAWLHHRRMAQPLFNRTSVDAMVPTMTSFISGMCDRWERQFGDGRPFDIVPEMMHVSLNILSRVMFGVDLGDELERLGPAVRFSLTAMIFSGSLAQLLPGWLPLPYHRRVRRDRAALHALMDRVIAAHRGEHAPDDLVSLLLDARDPDTGQPLTHEEIRDEMMTIFLAGHETTGTGLAWMLYSASKHPAVIEKLEEEVDRVLNGRTVTLDDLANLPYSRMVVQEALRMHPPIWLYPRDAAADDDIGGYHIPAGSSVFLTPYVTHRHPAFWDNPEAFDPDRFTPERVARRPRFAYFPFGGGQRQCIGNHMALLQMQVLLVTLAQRCRLQAVSGHPVEHAFLVSLRPVHGILMSSRQRAQAVRTDGSHRSKVEAPALTCPFAHVAASGNGHPAPGAAAVDGVTARL